MSVRAEIRGEDYSAKSYDQLEEKGNLINRLAAVVWFNAEVVNHLGEWKAKGYNKVSLVVKNVGHSAFRFESWTEIADVNIDAIGIQ